MKRWAPSIALFLFLGALVFFLMPSVNLSEAQVTKTQHTIGAIRIALEAFKKDVGRYPTNQENLSALIENTVPPLASWHGPYAKAIQTDLWGHPFIYSQPGKHGKPYAVSSSGPDAKPGTDDDITE